LIETTKGTEISDTHTDTKYSRTFLFWLDTKYSYDTICRL